MVIAQRFKALASVLGVLVFLSGLSYCSERPKYHFEKVAIAVGEEMQGARLIDSFKSGDLASPVSWFWPATTTWVYAIPDVQIKNRFVTVTLVYGESEPSILLQDVDCVSGQSTMYSELGDEDTAAALDFYGNPVVAPNGKTYRRFESSVVEPKKQQIAFCDTDWSSERAILRRAD
tara:strand:- start:1517 stop:2044 length:528 start_codon:yes stop_codon:yes gene_type:complete